MASLKQTWAPLTDLLAVNYWCLIQDLSLRQWLATGLCRSDEGGKPGKPGRNEQCWVGGCFSKVGFCFRRFALAALSCFIVAQGPTMSQVRRHCEISGVSTCALANSSLGVHASFRDPAVNVQFAAARCLDKTRAIMSHLKTVDWLIWETYTAMNCFTFVLRLW